MKYDICSDMISISTNCVSNLWAFDILRGTSEQMHFPFVASVLVRMRTHGNERWAQLTLNYCDTRDGTHSNNKSSMKTRRNCVETSSYGFFLRETEKDAVSAHFVDISFGEHLVSWKQHWKKASRKLQINLEIAATVKMASEKQTDTASDTSQIAREIFPRSIALFLAITAKCSSGKR